MNKKHVAAGLLVIGIFALSFQTTLARGRSSTVGGCSSATTINNTDTAKPCKKTATSITLTAPTGTKTYKSGASLTVTWKTKNVPASTVVDIIMTTYTSGYAQTGTKFLGSSSNDGTATLTLPVLSAATLFKITVVPEGSPVVKASTAASYATLSAGTVAAVAPTTDTTTPAVKGSLNGQPALDALVANPNAPTLSIVSGGQTTSTVAAITGAKHGMITMTIPVSFTAGAKNVYIPAAVKPVTNGTVATPTSTSAVVNQYAIDNGTSLVQSTGVMSGVLVYTGDNNLTVDANKNYTIAAGSTETFNMVIKFDPKTAGTYSAQLVDFKANTTDSATKYTKYGSGFNTPDYKTPAVTVQ